MLIILIVLINLVFKEMEKNVNSLMDGHDCAFHKTQKKCPIMSVQNIGSCKLHSMDHYAVGTQFRKIDHALVGHKHFASVNVRYFDTHVPNLN